ncbi:MAG: hypothetical protein KC635_28200, partial [Myxococcales bacterium]|nr:hypothetical protein [Myxococcales bacterium]
NPCTAERCDAYAGCVYDYLVDPCDDGNPCTANDRCTAGVCRGAPVAVDDGDACTTDACDVESGVTHEPNVDIPCDDGDACTADGHCSVDGCVGAPPIDCDDGNPCTSDTCDAATGCAWAFNSDACDDGDACTAGDTCAAGSCVGTGVSCDDGDACTNDWCDPASGCVFDPVVSAGCRPVIVVTSPARAARLTSDADVVFVTGSVTSGAGALTAVTIDGEPLELGPDGAFVHALTGVGAGLHTFAIEATDDHGYTERHVQSFVTSSEYLQSVVDRYLAYPASAGIEVFLGQDALDDGDHGPPPNDLGAVAELVVRGIDPVSLTPDPFVLNDDYTAYVKRLRYDVESVELTPTATGLELDARLVAVAMDVGVVGTCALCPRATGVATSPSLDLHAKLVVTDEQIPPADGEPVDPTNRRLVATATTLTVTLGDLDVTLDDDVLDFLLGPLTTKVANVMKGTVEDLLGTSLKGTLEGMMSSAVGAFRPSFGVNVAPVVDGGYALEGILGSRPQAPTHVTSGLELRFAVGAAGVYHRVPYPWVGVPKLTTCDGVTPLPEAVTLPREHAVELLLEDDVANQLVWGLWEGGLLEFDVPPALLAGVSLEDFGVTDLAMHLSGMLPPTLDGCDGALKMRFGDMDFRVTMNVLGEPRSLDVYVAMTANVALRPVDGELEVALSDVAAIQTQVDVHGDAVLLGMIGKIRDAVDGALVPNLVTLLAAQPLMRYPLPTFDLGGLSAAIPARTTLSVVVDSVARQGGTLVLAHLEAPELCESDAVCPDGTFCKDGACVSCLGQGDCVADPPPPEDPADPPVTPQYCLLTDDWGLQRCADRRENGLRQTCANDYECLSGHCSAGGYCVACVTSADCRQADGGWCEDEACVPTFSDDTACESDDQCDSLHCGTGVFERFCYTPGSRAPGEGCHVQAQCASEQCLVGDVCGCNGRHETCGAGRWCDAGSTCQDALADGHVCGGDVECASGVCDTVCVECTALPLAGCDFARQYCEGTTCHEKGGIGDDCGFDDQCFSGT